MTLLALLIACKAEPVVTIAVGPVEDRVVPDVLADTLDNTFVGPMRSCYAAVLERDPGLSGQVVVTVKGSHGVLRQDAADGALPELVDCALSPLQNRAMARKYSAGDTPSGFILTIDFHEDPWP